MNNKLFQAAMPTHPVQNQLGQVVVSFGLSTIEYAAIHIAGHLQAADMNLLPETVAQVSVDLAEQIIIECQNRANRAEIEQEEKKKPTIISLNP